MRRIDEKSCIYSFRLLIPIPPLEDLALYHLSGMVCLAILLVGDLVLTYAFSRGVGLEGWLMGQGGFEVKNIVFCACRVGWINFETLLLHFFK